MAFLEQRVSTYVRRGTSGGPTARRNLVYDGSGRLAHQQFLAQDPTHRYRFDFGAKLLADAEQVRDFFYVVLFTPYTGFRVRDWNDYALTQSKSKLVALTGNDWQIHRRYAVGAVEFLRKIVKIEPATAVIYRTRSGAVTVATATVNDNTGVATITGHVGGDTYTCEALFDVPVTFADDDALARIALDGSPSEIVQQFGEIELVEVSGL